MDGQPDVPEEFYDEVAKVALALPETSVRTDRWAHAFQIRRKMFAILAAPADRSGEPVPILVVHADPTEREVLLSIGHPYFASRSTASRVGVVLGPSTDWEEMGELVTESYRILAPQKLVKLLDEDGA